MSNNISTDINKQLFSPNIYKCEESPKYLNIGKKISVGYSIFQTIKTLKGVKRSIEGMLEFIENTYHRGGKDKQVETYNQILIEYKLDVRKNLVSFLKNILILSDVNDNLTLVDFNEYLFKDYKDKIEPQLVESKDVSYYYKTVNDSIPILTHMLNLLYKLSCNFLDVIKLGDIEFIDFNKHLKETAISILDVLPIFINCMSFTVEGIKNELIN